VSSIKKAGVICVNVTVLVEIIPVDGMTKPDDREGSLEVFTLPRSQFVLKLRNRCLEASFGASVDLRTTRLGGLSERWRRHERDD
jgi:hypothetical protein